MNYKLTPQYLKNYEIYISNLFHQKKIRAPIHLYDGNEKQIIKIFKKINKNDWVFCSWRSHYQCLLKGVPEKKLTKSILAGNSISLCFPKYRIFSSAIVGGILPISLGLAKSIKNKKKKEKVYCFLGDMTSETGIAMECIKYAINKNLPIIFVIEDNEISVCKKKKKTWSQKKLSFGKFKSKHIIYYKYKSKYPHAGSGQRIQF